MTDKYKRPECSITPEDAEGKGKINVLLDKDNTMITFSAVRNNVICASYVFNINDKVVNLSGLTRMIEITHDIDMKSIHVVATPTQFITQRRIIDSYISKCIRTIPDEIYFDMGEEFNDSLFKAINSLYRTPTWILTRVLKCVEGFNWRFTLHIDGNNTLCIAASTYHNAIKLDTVFECRVIFEYDIIHGVPEVISPKDYKVVVHSGTFDISKTISDSFSNLFNQVQWES